MLNEFFAGIWVGVAAWFATGIDDFLVVLFYMNLRRSSLNTVSVVTGTVLAVLVMIWLCVGLDLIAENVIETIGNLRLLGVVPMLLGIYGVIRWIRDHEKKAPKWGKWAHAFGIAGVSFLTYLSNSTDDIIVNTSILQSSIFHTLSYRWWGFVVGILMGAVITCVVASLLLMLRDQARKRFMESQTVHWLSHYLSLSVNIAIVVVGLTVLLGLLPV